MKSFYGILGASLVAAVSASAQISIFNDSFALDPSLNGWTESVITTNTATGAISPTGTGAEIEKTGGSGRVEGSITRTINTVGFEGIELELISFQSNTGFEGGAFGANNVDSLSVYIDTGSGFTALFQRTGVWDAPGTGFSDGGTGAGTTIPTSTGFIQLAGAADNNPNLQIRIEGFVSANAESYFLDDFTLRGTVIAVSGGGPGGLVAGNLDPTRTGPGRRLTILVRDDEAVLSLLASGVPFVSTLDDLNLSAVQSAGRDLNSRLFRLRAGLGFGDNSGPSTASTIGITSIVGGYSLLPKELAVSAPQHGPLQWFTEGDFASTDRDAFRGVGGFNGDARSGSFGMEYSNGGKAAFGLAYTYLENDFEFGNGLGGADIEGNSVSAYATWVPVKEAYVSFLYSFTDLQNDLRRNTGLGSIVRGSPDADAHSFDLDGGYLFELGSGSSRLVTGPIVGLEYIDGAIDGYSETGALRGALDVSEQNFQSLVSTLGWQISKPMDVNGWKIIPQLRLAWEHEYEGSAETTNLSLQQSPFFLVNGNSIRGAGGGFGALATTADAGRDYLVGGAGLRVELGENCAVLLDYEGNFFRDNQTTHFGGVSLQIRY